MTNASERSPTAPPEDLDALPLLGPDQLSGFGATVIVAPHPDDETLGCGGLIAMLNRMNVPVKVVVTSDGCGSHPNSRQFPATALRDLREAEASAAVQALGMDRSDISFMRLPDTKVPFQDEAGFDGAVRHCRSLLAAFRPETVLLPWRRDPHSDHRATWHIVIQAACQTALKPRMIEYPIWIWDLGGPADAPFSGEMCGWRLDISSVLDRKIAAIDAHQSQITGLIGDDPMAFRLNPAMLDRFRRPWETFLEPTGE